MSIFEAGFVFWGYLAIYIVLTLAYFGWMAALNRRESRRTGDRRENG
ncbi:hypothetical protein [Jiangella mangrovi]|uniref:Uncharacterized protein n=1 Tax=Jiangella mangrovi TaxID=1524084 RepID=A0A7W9LKG4_9ACTN|nr:hypothetical protein [Jiangella mangrovi]MBB5787032.1 hypothetical protein [Jiangella mangrovi]